MDIVVIHHVRVAVGIDHITVSHAMDNVPQLMEGAAIPRALLVMEISLPIVSPALMANI